MKKRMMFHKRCELFSCIFLFLHQHLLYAAASVAATTSDSFPARLPRSTWYTDGGSSSDDGGGDDQSEMEDRVMSENRTSERQDPPGEVPSETNYSAATDNSAKYPAPPDVVVEANEPRIQRGNEEDNPSQPLQTLHKLQQMLDETDYMTSRRESHQSMGQIPNQSDPPSRSRDSQQQIQVLERRKHHPLRFSILIYFFRFFLPSIRHLSIIQALGDGVIVFFRDRSENL